ncbi:MAG: molybdenum cofactor biosynthesis protein MoaE [Deltaproteobacteria bacterium]|nr:molybdenum cofactor biosynthesis protein MoaE [Deltaproteobacteria bacterium]MBW2049621.1 molybdenum cofactor biosynthesis protein MoaE [Deltaproteobacteria bacterium]MBW2110211.1 molybdenum cofactor biosynthesis protein MoaE [Deltaproteobacteria bacterium]MBW2352941.1 molybdenum cofactor biosynthesis protein MoaE [Deltaproteobacteria bacterium]HDZ90419.1 molybdenum cofactor biosynthesis protein MoaE [Deltaproteobacteria bacterium]
MDIGKMIQRLKEHPDYPKMGMIASHLGVVRETSLTGGRVSGIEVKFDKEAVNRIVNDIKKLDGIIEILIETSDGRLEVGEEIMAVVVGGDIREHVFPALIKTVDMIKREGASKREFPAS